MTREPLTPENSETSPEILDAIARCTDGESAHIASIWDDPSDEELLSIWQHVTQNGLMDSHAFTWGTMGRNWADDIEA
jgi:hypothetical protein